MTPHEQEVRVDVEGRTLKLSNLDKVLYPRTGTTKGEVLNYYAQISPVLLPLLKDRPVTRVRWPHGVERDRFFEKNTPAGTPAWVRTADVPTTGSRGDSRHGDRLVFPIIDDLATLTWAANLAALELHVHQWTVTRQGKPRGADRLVIDLDPGEGAGLHECCRVALLVRERLSDLGLPAAPVTSGSKGLHLYAALPGRKNAEQIRDQAQQVARELAEQEPALVVWKMTKALRPGKVFLDWSQNTAAKTTIAPYSLRGKARPSVAAPRTWDEVEEGADAPDGLRQLELDEVLARVEADGDVFGALLDG
jgi:bifunctional non-homologous end joining protein LigD